VADFDYNAPAELFSCRTTKGNRPVGYHRFDTAAEAIRFAIELMPPDLLLGAVLEVEEERLSGNRIRELYDSTAYPFTRTGNSSSGG
jgi:hypothetical protein